MVLLVSQGTYRSEFFSLTDARVTKMIARRVVIVSGSLPEVRIVKAQASHTKQVRMQVMDPRTKRLSLAISIRVKQVTTVRQTVTRQSHQRLRRQVSARW